MDILLQNAFISLKETTSRLNEFIKGKRGITAAAADDLDLTGRIPSDDV